MTNLISDSNWNQCTYFFRLFPSLDLTVRATADWKTLHFKENYKKMKKLSIRSAENSTRWNVKELCIDAVFFTLIRLLNRFITKKFLSNIKCCISSYWWGWISQEIMLRSTTNQYSGGEPTFLDFSFIKMLWTKLCLIC